MLTLGAHMSIAGGVEKAVLAAKTVGCDVAQIFTRNTNQWAARPLGEAEIAAFRRNERDCGVRIVAAHGSYLINLGSPDPALQARSREGFRLELDRCERLGLPYLVVHPGAHCGDGEEAAIRRIAAALDTAHAATPGYAVTTLIEITAGQGSSIGHRFEHLAEIVSRVADPVRVGVCFDTCHAHAAGYELRSESGYHQTFEAFDRIVGLGRLKAFHLNDSRGPLGCRVDRHWHIGRGLMGAEPFRLLLNDPRFDGLPGILETPKGPEYAEDVRNLAVLRRLAGDARPKRAPKTLRLLPGSLVKAGRAVAHPKTTRAAPVARGRAVRERTRS